jgi:hypothetical protein
MDPWQIVLGAVGIVGALIGAIYVTGQRRDDKQDERVGRNEAAVREHDKAIAELRTDMTNVKAEVRSLREMRHEIIEQCTHALAEWYQKVVDMIAKLK